MDDKSVGVDPYVDPKSKQSVGVDPCVDPKSKQSVGVDPCVDPKIEKLKDENAKAMAGWQRSQADYHNLVKEYDEKLSEFRKYAKADVLMELLPIIDKYRMAMNFVPQEQAKEPWFVGITNIQSLFQDFLKQNGVEEIVAVGQPFDPNIHEAVATEKSAKYESNVVIKEISKGYKMGDKVIVLAKVVVAE